MAKAPKYQTGKRYAPTPPAVPRPDIYISLFLLLATLAIYVQVSTYEFVSYDDPEYITENAQVRGGLTPENLAWAFTSNRDGNWFPLTWLSHMLDYRLFGLNSGGHHLVNVLLHLLSTFLLFAILSRMTGSRWRSAFVAALFALHPLHVESVAWVAERKDVLSGLFWMLTLWGYVRYVERPKPGRYLLVLLPFCLGLMSKAMIVTLPFVLLLLDIWPLRRLAIVDAHSAGSPKLKTEPARNTKSISGILVEKAPLFALSGIVAAVTFMAQKSGGAVVSTDWIPVGKRIGNALISYIAYIFQMFWPARLAAFYSMPDELPAWQIIGAGIVLSIISILALRSLRRAPYVAVGWFWYLGTLIPVIGLVQVGMQARADRYTYIPLIGLFMVLAWGLPEALQRRPKAGTALATGAALACAACMILTWNQVQTWRNSKSLFQHAIDVEPGGFLGYYGMGGVLQNQGRPAEALPSYLEAVRLAPRHAGAHSGLGNVYLSLGRIDAAIAQLSEALRLSPDSVDDHISIGIALNRQGKSDEAAAQLLAALRLNPDSAIGHYNLGNVYAGAGKLEEALAQFKETIRLQPDYAEAHYNLGMALASQGMQPGAIDEFRAAIRLKPDYARAHNNLGSALARLGRIDEAITHFSEALRIDRGFEEARRNLEYATALKNNPNRR